MTDLDRDALARALNDLLLDRSARMREEWDRELPLLDMVFDRWERAERLGFGDGASIYASASVFGDVHVGDRTWVGPDVILDGSGGALRIGSYCSISASVHIYTHDTVRWALSLGQAAPRTGPVSIGDGCHIGAQSTIASGVTIGDQVVVAANSFVRRDVPSRTVVGGNPATSIGSVVGEGAEVALVMTSQGERSAR